MKKILLAGDSWGWVWFPFEMNKRTFVSKTYSDKMDSQTHKHTLDTGHLRNSFPLLCVLLEYYGFDVTYVAYPGSSNYHQIKMMKNRLQDESFDMALFFHTDPLRDLIEGYDLEDFVEKTQMNTWTKSKLLQELDQVYANIYQDLDDICVEHNLPVLLLGGHSVVSEHHLEKHRSSNLLQCVSKHILTDLASEACNSNEEFPALGFNTIKAFVDDSWNNEVVRYFYENNYNGNAILDAFMTPDFCHMNAGSAVMLVEKLLQHMEKNNLI